MSESNSSSIDLEKALDKLITELATSVSAKKEKQSKENAKKYYKENKERIKQYLQKYREKNPKYFQKYREKNKEKIKALSSRWYNENKEYFLQIVKNYDLKHKEQAKARKKKYYEKNKEKIKQKNKKRYEANREKILERQKRVPKKAEREKWKKKMTESNDLEDKLDEAIRGIEKIQEEKTTVKERGFYEEFAKTQDLTNLKRPVYVIHEHHSSRLHWDLRFEDGGVMRTWRLYKSPPQIGNKILAQLSRPIPIGAALF